MSRKEHIKPEPLVDDSWVYYWLRKSRLSRFLILFGFASLIGLIVTLIVL